MALPLIFLPPGIPTPLIEGFGISLGEQFDHSPALQGEARKRRMFRSAPRQVSVNWLLSSSQMAAFDAWAENDLDVLSRRFTVKLKALGQGFEYWAAEWTTPYTAEPLLTPDWRWRVSGSLLLTGEPFDAPPETGKLELTTTISLGGSGSLTVPNELTLVTWVSLGTIAPLTLTTAVVLSYITPYDAGGYELRDESGFELREDGGRELRE